MAYVADADYFCYPNIAENNMGTGIKRFERAMAINARQLGSLSARGIVHTAPIPLFHNRIQHARRDDLGFYEWFRGGRLDRWLFSCDHPNMGVSGLRDFEHFISFSGSNRRMYRWIGTHLLSILLLIGSYFRNLDRRRLGRDREGNPADARDLFDETAMARMVTMVFNEYYRGFTQYDRLREMPLDITALCRRMVEEMGVDRHMEEVLRVQDQLEMSEEGFCRLLVAGGWSRDRIRDVKKGEREITLMTGPHLGGFNDRISLPEMIEAVETMSAMCLYGRYRRLNGNRI
jgi:hypothetical protein